MTTPAAEAIRGLVEALRRPFHAKSCTCDDCAVNGAALAAFEKRQPLREDLALVRALLEIMDKNPTVLPAGEILDYLDAALFGPPTKEGSSG